MHYLKHPQSTASATTIAFSNRLSRFDALDWIAAAFVIATPIIIANRLF